MPDLVLREIDAYAAAHSLQESPVRRALREETEQTMEFARMLVGPLEGGVFACDDPIDPRHAGP